VALASNRGRLTRDARRRRTRIADSVVTDREQFLAAVHANDAPAALHVYRGPFLQGLSIPDGDEFEDWAAVERRHLEGTMLRIGESYARQQLSAGRLSHARDIVESLVLKAPESLVAQRIAVAVMLDGGDLPAARRWADVLEVTAALLGAMRRRPYADSSNARARSTYRWRPSRSPQWCSISWGATRTLDSYSRNGTGRAVVTRRFSCSPASPASGKFGCSPPWQSVCVIALARCHRACESR
jgi:hypothetical protein